jgi:hypothetical protein
MRRLLIVFLDGVGIGPADEEVNPFFRASLPTLTAALGGRLPSIGDPHVSGATGRAFPIDACLGVDGVPQSGTGQVALLTGQNAPRLLGRHFGPWPPFRLRPLLEDKSLFRRAMTGGARAVFANAYPPRYLERVSLRRVSAVALAAHAAGLLRLDHEALGQGRAVASEIVNDVWRRRLGLPTVPVVSPEAAGANLARIAESADLTLFAHYDTDFVGHRGGMEAAVSALERVDHFIAGILSEAPPEILVLVVSDHGNLEDVRVGHTRNPALGMALGPSAHALPAPLDLTAVPEVALRYLVAESAATSRGTAR